MKPIENPPPPPISPQSDSAAIANLHEALLFLLAKERLHLPEDVASELREDSSHQTYGNGTMRAVMAFRQQNGLEGGEVVDEQTAHELNRLLEALDAFAAPQAEWLIRGQVFDANGPVAGIRVVAYDRDLGPARHLLGEAVTNADGVFRIAYGGDAFVAAEGERPPLKAAPDLVFDFVRGGVSVKPTAIIRILLTGAALVAPDDLLAGIPARDDEELRIAIPVATPPAEADEYTLLWQAILPLLPDQPPADVEDAERERRVCTAALDLNEAERRDITFVAREIGWPLPLVERFVNACRLSAHHFDHEVTPAELYGLAAAGFSDLRALATVSLVELEAALRRAAAGALIPAIDATRAAQAAELIRRRAPRRLLEPVGETLPRLTETLDLTGLEREKQARLLRFAADHKGPAAEFWAALRQHETLGHSAGQVEYVLQLGALTGQNMALMRGLTAQFPAVHSLRALALQADEEQLRQLLAQPEIQLSPHAVGATPEEQRERLTQSLVGLLRAADPTAAAVGVARCLSQEATPPVSQAGAHLLERLASERPDFDLLTARVADFAPLFDGEEAERQTAIGDIKRMQRLLRLSTSEANFAGLMRTSLNAASDIPASYTRSGFIEAVGDTLGTVAEADLTYRRAVAISATTLIAAVQAHQITADVQPYAVTGAPATPESENSLATWANLFGPVELCECEHCRSWYGPSAYLVDLLLFLEKRNNAAPGPTALEALRQRRPDIEHLQLTCENANTTLPLIDLVNEILEFYIAHGNDFDDFRGHNVSDESAAELRASPQHVEQKAYDELAQALYPTTLPFNRWLEVVRAILARLETPRPALLAAFEQASGAPATAARQRRIELLGLSEQEYRLITGSELDGSAAEIPLGALYGLAPDTTPAAPAAALKTADKLQAGLGLTFAQLTELMSCGFINPALRLEGSLQRVYDDFDLDAAQLRAFVAAGFTADAPLAAHLATRNQTADQLKALLEELFTAASMAELIIFQGQEGDPAQMELVHADGQSLTGDELRRMTALVRLWRKVGWPMAELDRALRALGAATTITPAALDSLADLSALVALWGGSATELLPLWADLDTYGAHSPYHRLFQTRAFGQPADPDFRLRFTPVTLENGEVTHTLTTAEKSFSDKKEAIAVALRQPADNLKSLLDAWNVTRSPAHPTAEELTTTSPTTVANLSRLVRLTTLSRLLDLAPAELGRLAKLSAIDPFTTPQATMAFARLAQQMQKAGLDVAGLDYLLSAKAIPAGAPDEAALEALATAIADELAEMRRAQAPAETVTEEGLRQKLQLIVSGQSAAFIAALVAGTLKKPPAEGDLTSDQRLQAELEARRAELAAHLSPEQVKSVVPEWQGLGASEAHETKRQRRLTAAGEAFQPALTAHLGRAIVRTAIQDAFGLDEPMARLWLEETAVFFRQEGENKGPIMELFLQLPDGASQARSLLRAIHRLALLVETLRLEPDELRYVAAHGERFDGLDFTQPALGAGAGIGRWQRLAEYAALRDRLGARSRRLVDVFLAAEEERVAALGEATGWPRALVDDALKALGLEPEDLADERSVATLATVVKLAQGAGASAGRLKQWAFGAPDRQQAEEVVAAARVKAGESAWLEMAQAINDPLRERQRDALVAHLLTFPEIKSRGVNSLEKLYEFFLIDVGTGACMLTSRVVQASAAVQLFVQRIHLGLEDKAFPGAPRLAQDAVDAEEWEWRKNYRVWEANRRIFLYPENYLLPELRDDCSPFFRELQSELSEGTLSPEQIERALFGYLGKVEATSRLEIVGSYRQVEAFPPTDVLHVFGRTMSGVPRSYYYRRLVDKEWTPWEPVTVDIQGVERDEETGVSGVHLLPVVWKGKLYLFWPQFVTKQENEAPPEADGGKVNVQKGITLKRPRPYWEIRLAWSWLEDGRWAPKQLSDVFLRRFKDKQKPAKKGSPVIHGTGAAVSHVSAGLHLQLDSAELNELVAIQLPMSEGLHYQLDSAGLNEAAGELPAIQLQSLVDGSGGLTIEIIERGERPDAVGAVTFADAYAAPAVRTALSRLLVDLRVDDGRPHYQGQARYGSLWLYSLRAKLPATQLLYGYEGNFVVTPLAQSGAPSLATPFFYGDALRLYYVQLWPDVELDFPNLAQPRQKPNPSLLAPVTSPSPANGQSAFTVLPPSSAPAGSLWARATAELGLMSLNPGSAASGGNSAASPAGYFSTLPVEVVDGLPSPVADAVIADMGLDRRQSLKARFYTFFHPHAATFGERLRRGGLAALLSLDSQKLGAGDDTFRQIYQPVEARLSGELPRHHVDFSPQGPYALYNWELFYHIPFLLADELRKAGRFADALRMIRLIFDPLDSTPNAGVERFWRVLPLQRPHERVVEMFEALEPGADSEAKQDVLDQLARMASHPFQPFRIARLRLGAFQKAAVMLFCDICLEAGDALFRQDTRESVGEALQYYVLVANVLGETPQVIRRINRVAPQSFAQLRPRLTAAGNAFVEAENELLFAGVGATGGQTGMATLLSLGRTLYFCLPQNEKLLGYWETVQDRLFKLRNCMNIEGVVRQLALFAPRIDPLLLARAAAAGLDLSAVLADLNSPLPRYRFHTMLQKALEMAAELKSLGASLLSALEKKEAERLAVMRAGHEHLLVDRMRLVRQWQVKEVEAGLNTLFGARAKAIYELQHFAALLGVDIGTITIPPAPADLPDKPPETLANVKPVTPLQTHRGRFELVGGGAITLSGAAVGAAAGGMVGGPVGAAAGAAIGSILGDIELANFDTGTKILRLEQEEIWQSFLAAAYSMGGASLRALGTVLSLIPQAEIAAKPLGVGGGVSFGGIQMHKGPVLGADIMAAISAWHGFQASLAGKQASYVWRHQELMLRFNSAALEIGQIDRQILAAKIRLQVARNELATQDKQAEYRLTELVFQRDLKFTREQLYAMLERSLGRFFNEAYKLAHDLARQAERAYRFQTGDEGAAFIKPTYWDGQRRGLLCGEELHLDLKRMERAFLQHDRRDYELTRHVSLRQLNPSALIDLRLNGRCEFELPEWLFDLDFPGHFFRRVKSVAVTVPSISGPYTGVSGTLTLLASKVRVKAVGDGDDSFAIDPVPIQSIAISSGQNDSGLFELSFRDDRFLPFEGAGAAGAWRFELPTAFRAFDYETIADLVLHIRYTAREGGGALAQRRTKALTDAFKAAQAGAPLSQLFSLRHEFPGEWHRLVNAIGSEERTQEFVITGRHFPLIFAGRELEVTQIKALAVTRTGADLTLRLFTPGQNHALVGLEAGPSLLDGLVKQWATPTAASGALATVKDKPTEANWQLTLSGSLDDLEDIMLLFGYQVKS